MHLFIFYILELKTQLQCSFRYQTNLLHVGFFFECVRFLLLLFETKVKSSLFLCLETEHKIHRIRQ